MRTDGAWIYFCKECNNYHLVKYETFKDENPKEYEVYIVCPYTKHSNGQLYDGKSFQPYLDYFYTIQDNLVDVNYLRKKEARLRMK